MEAAKLDSSLLSLYRLFCNYKRAWNTTQRGSSTKTKLLWWNFGKCKESLSGWKVCSRFYPSQACWSTNLHGRTVHCFPGKSQFQCQLSQRCSWRSRATSKTRLVSNHIHQSNSTHWMCWRNRPIRGQSGMVQWEPCDCRCCDGTWCGRSIRRLLFFPIGLVGNYLKWKCAHRQPKVKPLVHHMERLHTFHFSSLR